MLAFGLFLLNGALLAGCQPEGLKETGSLENVTVHVIDSNTVQVFWANTWKNVERYDITYNPAEDRIVTQAAGNSNSVVLRELRPNTRYQVIVSAVINGRNYKSRRLVFKTANGKGHMDLGSGSYASPKPTKSSRGRSPTAETVNPDPTAAGSKYTPQTSTTVRGVEIGLVLLALVVWIIAISLFFHRWGKIRMLLPYQPDYKTQQSLKVPGTGTTSSSGRHSGTGNGGTQAQQEGPSCVQHLRWSFRHLDERAAATKFSPSKFASRSRVSSAIFPASPPFYARTSLECEAGRAVRQVQSHNDLSAEAIPLCRMSRPENERAKKCSRLSEDSKNNFFIKREAKETKDSSFVVNENCLSVHRARDSPAKNPGSDGEFDQLRIGDGHEAEPLFFIETSSFHVGNSERQDAAGREHRIAETKKSKRYTRSSLRKQKMQYCEDYDPETGKTVPTPETRPFVERTEKCFPTESRNEKSNGGNTADLKRKTFLRKISLQDTHLNYNQDYWLDHRKSVSRFHKSIDLGYLGEGTSAQREARKMGTSTERKGWANGPTAAVLRPLRPRDGFSPPRWSGEEPTRCDSEPLFLSLNSFEMNPTELLGEVATRCRAKWNDDDDDDDDDDGATRSWFRPDSNDNLIPLFSDRNGLIETDFDVFDACDGDAGTRRRSHSRERATSEDTSSSIGGSGDHSPFALPLDPSTFYEVKLRESGQEESDEECVAFNETEFSAVFNKKKQYSMSFNSPGFHKSTNN